MIDSAFVSTLKANGIYIKEPEIRSSDYSLVLNDPFLYFLRRRCGLVPAFSWSKALSRGSWFAERMLYFLHPNPAEALAAKLNTRIAELSELCVQHGINGDARHAIIEREKKDYACAIGWYESSRSLKLIDGKTYEQYFSQSHWRLLGSEVKVRVKYNNIPLIAQFDHLFYNEKNHQVWVIDDKTTAFDPHTRVMCCPNEFQSQLYTFVLDIAIKEGLLDRFKLGPDIRAAGIWHIALQKPTIDFCSKDRPYRWFADGVRKGFRGTWCPVSKVIVLVERSTGAVVREDTVLDQEEAIQIIHSACGKKPTKQYEGEPDLNMYVKRCDDWYQGKGEYEHLSIERSGRPPIAYSWLDCKWMEQVHEETITRIKIIDKYRIQPPVLANFPKGQDLLTIGGKLSDYASFYTNGVNHWPSIILDNHMIIAHRDETCTDETFLMETYTNGEEE